MSANEPAGALLPEPTRRLLGALMRAMIEDGAVPASETLAAEAGIAPADLPDRLRDLAAADYVAFDGAGRLTCLYPLSATPTPHTVVINGERRHAMCAIDALGIPAMLGQELAIEGSCAVCDAPVALRVRPGAVRTSAPPTAMVVARRDEAEPAFAACCPFTVFVCGPDHAEQFSRRIGGANILTLTEALARAGEIFGGLLSDALPVTRPRGQPWDNPAPNTPILYTQPGCAESAKVRSWLSDRDIAFHERNASGDRNAADALLATGTFATPLLILGDEQVFGYHPGALAALIETRKEIRSNPESTELGGHS